MSQKFLGTFLGTDETGFRTLIDTKASYLVRRGGLAHNRKNVKSAFVFWAKQPETIGPGRSLGDFVV